MTQAICRLMLFQSAAEVVLAVDDDPAIIELDAFEGRRHVAKLRRFAAATARCGSTAYGGDGRPVELFTVQLVIPGNGFEFLVGEELGCQIAESTVET